MGNTTQPVPDQLREVHLCEVCKQNVYNSGLLVETFKLTDKVSLFACSECWPKIIKELVPLVKPEQLFDLYIKLTGKTKLTQDKFKTFP